MGNEQDYICQQKLNKKPISEPRSGSYCSSDSCYHAKPHKHHENCAGPHSELSCGPCVSYPSDK